MSNSPLACYRKISPSRTKNRNHKIDTITIHCTAGHMSLEGFGDWFQNCGASCNYVVAKDGRIGVIVDEKDRSWCSSNRENDHRAITIEVSSNNYHPYAVTDASYNALIDLCADVCRRNNIPRLMWKGDKSLIGHIDQQNMTVHRWFKNKACPGDYLYSRLGDIANKVNQKLGASSTTPTRPTTPDNTPTDGAPFKVKITIDNLNIRKGPGKRYPSAGYIKPGIYTIVDVKNADSIRWGKLKSGAGWIALNYASKI